MSLPRLAIPLLVALTLFGYAVRRSDGWRPATLAIQRESLQSREPQSGDLEAMCAQALITPLPVTRAGSCESAYPALETALGPAAAKTLVQACNDKHAVFDDAFVRLPNPALCRHGAALPPPCKPICGGAQ
jgi:hypothetical protein